MKAHCLFEQSGTFKNEFKKLGIEAFDYDILNEYGETDYQIDLFAEIVGGGTKEDHPYFTRLRRRTLYLLSFPVLGLNAKCQCYSGENQISSRIGMI